MVYLCQLPAGCFFKRRTTFIGDGRILLELAWIRGGEDEEVLEWRRVTVVLFFSRGRLLLDGRYYLRRRLICFKDGRYFFWRRVATRGHRNIPLCVLRAKRFWLSSLSGIWLYASAKSILVKPHPPLNFRLRSLGRGSGWRCGSR